eukprot:2681733-Pyramimonas_sp.AAC.1
MSMPFFVPIDVGVGVAYLPQDLDLPPYGVCLLPAAVQGHDLRREHDRALSPSGWADARRAADSDRAV